jgi:Tfp pilus assembly protein PilP
VRVEDRVLDPEEKKGIRHQFKDRDFVVEQNNRDPFQSFVLNQGITNPSDAGLPRVVTPKCQRPEQLVATNYSYTDLRLVGIVAQGTQRKVLMMDAGNLGHIIKRGDCVGREKAVVKDIGTGYVTFQVEPDETASGQARTGEERSIQLYPNQMPITSQPTLDNEAAKGLTPDVAPPTQAPPPSRPAPQK